MEVDRKFENLDAIVIGAGISGVTVARGLLARRQKVLVLEKSRSVGGRIATRRDNEFTYDHGAQFYCVKQSDSLQLDTELMGADVAQTWFQNDSGIYRTAKGGMTRIAKYLAADLPIVFNERVVRIDDSLAAHLKVECELGQQFTAQKIFLSAPLPQSLAVLKGSEIAFPPQLEEVGYASALVGLFEVHSDDKQILQMKYEQDIDLDMYSVSNQLSKLVSSRLAFTVVMSPGWSLDNFDADEVMALAGIQQKFDRYLQYRSKAFQIGRGQLKKWKFSHPERPFASRFEIVGRNQNIFLIGDAFGGRSIISAHQSAQSVLDRLNESAATTYKDPAFR
jgi:renalase